MEPSALISQYDLINATIHCPCDDCYYSNHCQHECRYFKIYINTVSPAKRETQLIQFKLDQAEWLEAC